jgi:lysozyme family protein
MSFGAAMVFTLQWEGGYADVPGDAGGPTNMGITHATYDTWSTAVGLPRRDVRAITHEEVEAIYLCRYWLRAWCERMPDGVGVALFDGAVNSGPAQSVKWLQSAVGAKPDGLIGPATLAAVQLAKPATAVARMIDLRELFLHRIATQGENAKFLKGWLRRTTALRGATA